VAVQVVRSIEHRNCVAGDVGVAVCWPAVFLPEKVMVKLEYLTTFPNGCVVSVLLPKLAPCTVKRVPPPTAAVGGEIEVIAGPEKYKNMNVHQN
jgi:hypothetical protein